MHVDDDSSDEDIQKVECITYNGNRKTPIKSKMSISCHMGDAFAAWPTHL